MSDQIVDDDGEPLYHGYHAGDRVRLRKGHKCSVRAEVGAEAIVRAPTKEQLREHGTKNRWLYIDWDRNDPRTKSQGSGGYDPADFEPVDTYHGFRVGERVEYLGAGRGDSSAAKAGAFAWVKAPLDSHHRYLFVEWDREVNSLAETQMDGGYPPERFRAVNPESDIPATYLDLLELLDSFTTDEEREQDLKDLLNEFNS